VLKSADPNEQFFSSAFVSFCLRFDFGNFTHEGMLLLLLLLLLLIRTHSLLHRNARQEAMINRMTIRKDVDKQVAANLTQSCESRCYAYWRFHYDNRVLLARIKLQTVELVYCV